MRAAAIDVGTNTTRLLVAEATADGFRELDRRLVFTRLGEGLGESGAISPKAAERTLKAIVDFCAISGEFSVEAMTIAGTSAVRDAQNRDILLAAVKRIAGVDPVVLTGHQEAHLSFLGATADLPAGLYLVCDIGGGSTEFVLGRAKGTVEERISLDIGSVRLTERYLMSDPPATEEMLTMEGAIDDALRLADRDVPRAGLAKLVGVAGTVTSVAAIHLGLESYDPSATHHLEMSRSTVDSIYRELASMPLATRMALPSLPEGRADVIVAGASILSRVCAKWSFDRLVVSEKDILDGLVLELLDEENR